MYKYQSQSKASKVECLIIGHISGQSKVLDGQTSASEYLQRFLLSKMTDHSQCNFTLLGASSKFDNTVTRVPNGAEPEILKGPCDTSPHRDSVVAGKPKYMLQILPLNPCLFQKILFFPCKKHFVNKKTFPYL